MDHPADRLFEALLRAPSVLLTGPIGSDGDSLGASLAMARVLRDNGVSVEVTGSAGRRYGFMPGASDLLADRVVRERAHEAPWHTVVVLDGDRQRLTPGVSAAWERASVRGVVDHHVSTDSEGYDHVWLDAEATSTCHMVLTWLQRRGIALDEELATLLHTGNVFDTGGFRFENATPEVFRAAASCIEHGADHVTICTRVLQERRWQALQALAHIVSHAELLADGRLCVGRVSATLRKQLDLGPGDLEGVVDQLLFIEGVQVAALLSAGSKYTKVSLRSRGSVDVAKLAGELAPTGGGHRRASGARSTDTPAAIVAALVRAVG